jgi:hypothetical protein
MTTESQASTILRLLKQESVLTNRDLNRICYRYSARIHDLRKEGHDIRSNRVRDDLWEFSYHGEVE